MYKIKSGVVTCTIENYGYDGEGVARVDGKVVFIPYALKGELVRAEITKSHSSFSNAKLKEVVEPSEKRENPPCPYFGRCGGCSYQHTSYENELEIKRNLLTGQLKKIGFNGNIEVVRSQQKYQYRNKIRLFVGRNGLALREKGSHNLCHIDKCLLINDEMNKAITAINTFISAQNLFKVYSEIVIRQENDNLAVIFYRKNKDKIINYQGVFLMLGSHFGIFECYKNKYEYIMGLKQLECEEHGLKCKFAPNSFHQVNKFIGPMLYEFVVKNVVGKSVANCYSGAGVLSGYIASKKKRVVGIELGINEHRDAERLKEDNNLFFLSNHCGDCGEILPDIDEIDTIIVDPPRAGMEKKVVETINRKTCDRLIYISCNSATFIRDAERLSAYKLKQVSIFDMFARTGEYEVVGIFDKIK